MKQTWLFIKPFFFSLLNIFLEKWIILSPTHERPQETWAWDPLNIRMQWPGTNTCLSQSSCHKCACNGVLRRFSAACTHKPTQTLPHNDTRGRGENILWKTQQFELTHTAHLGNSTSLQELCACQKRALKKRKIKSKYKSKDSYTHSASFETQNRSEFPSSFYTKVINPACKKDHRLARKQ